MAAVSDKDRAAQAAIALALAERWIEERGGYVAFRYRVEVGPAGPAGVFPVYDVPIEQDGTYADAVATLRGSFTDGYDLFETQGRDYLRSPAYAAFLAENEENRRRADLADPIVSKTGVRKRYRGYDVPYLTGADIAALEAGFLAAADYDVYTGPLGHARRRKTTDVPIGGGGDGADTARTEPADGDGSKLLWIGLGAAASYALYRLLKRPTRTAAKRRRS